MQMETLLLKCDEFVEGNWKITQSQALCVLVAVLLSSRQVDML